MQVRSAEVGERPSRVHSTRMSILGGVTAALVVLAGCGAEGESSGSVVTSAPATSYKSSTALGSDLVDLVNMHRVSQGLDALVDWSPLAGVARGHSTDMADRHFFGHMDPEGRTVHHDSAPGERIYTAFAPLARGLLRYERARRAAEGNEDDGDRGRR